MTLDIAYTPQPASSYGRIISGVLVEQALVERIQTRVTDYLADTERQHGLAVGTIQRPRAFVVGERRVEDQLPAIVVRSTGTADLPEPDGRGRYAVRFALVLEINVAASADGLMLSKLYVAALRTLGVQQVPGLYMGIDWIDEKYADPDPPGDRTYYISTVQLEAHVPDVANRHEGPPDGWPGLEGPGSPAWPVAESADVELVKVPVPEPVQEG